jgi:peptide/nickel transport system substrate-binding protein
LVPKRAAREFAHLALLALICLASWSCRAGDLREDAAKPAVSLPDAPKPAEKAGREADKEATVMVSAQASPGPRAQVVVTSTPTPIPEGGTIIRAIYADAQTANPILAADAGSQALVQLLYEGLLRVDPFTGVQVGNFAAEWAVSEDGRTYTFTLREGLTWSDGKPITAHDFHFSYAALKSGALDTPNARHAAAISAIEVLDDRTFSVTFEQANCGNLEHLELGWLPMHVFTDDAEDYDFGRLETHEFNHSPWVFSGPFKLREWARGKQWILERNELYWQGAPHLDTVVTRLVSGQNELVALLEERQIDVGEHLRPQALARLEQVPDLRLYKFVDDGYDFLGFQLGDPDNPQPRLDAAEEDAGALALNEAHGEHPILGDARVRAAIVHAIDRQDLIDKARLGQGIPLHANVLPGVPWAYNTELEPRAYDPELARQLLDQAGWTLGADPGRDSEAAASDVRVRGGAPLKLRLVTNAGNEVRERMADLIRAQLAQVGIEVEVVLLDWYSFLDVLFGQTFDMVLMGMDGMGTNPDDLHLWSAANDLPVTTDETGQVPARGHNFVSYYSPEVEAWLEEARSAPGCDQERRAVLYRQVQARLAEDQPYGWIAVPRSVMALDARIGGVNPGPWSLWYNVHEWFVRE